MLQRKSRNSIYTCGITGFLSSVMLGAGSQPMLPKGRMLQELSAEPGTAYCRAQLVWWDLHVPESLDVLLYMCLQECRCLSHF